MHCHILIPGLSWAHGDANELCRGLALPSIETLLAKGHRAQSPALTPEHWLLERFGLQLQHDRPSAPFSLLAEGGTPGEDTWIHADPVHLRIERNRLVLADRSLLHIGRDEADALAAGVNAHFGESMTIFPVQPGSWYARLPARPDIETTPLSSVRGRAIDEWLPRGPDAARWQSVVNELQMLLHEHPVNAAREARGELPVNSVWFSGAGRLPPLPEQAFQYVAADDPLARGLAQASAARTSALPRDALAGLNDAGDAGLALFVIDALASASRYGDAGAWREALARLEQAWFAPLLAALRNGDIGMLTLHLPGDERTLEVETARADLRRFWHRRQPVSRWLS
jgi:hypothetical protein